MLMRGNFEAAHRIISMVEFTVQDKANSQLFDVPLAQSELPIRTLNLLERHGVITFGDLSDKGEEWILSLTNAGEGTLESIRDVLHYELMRRKK